MATNPQIPPREPRRDDHAHMDRIKGTSTKTWWPWLLILVSAAILAALIWWLPQSPKRTAAPSAAQVPAQPTGNQIQLSNLNMSTPTPGGAMRLTGTIYNAGNTSVNAIVAEGSFANINGNVLETIKAPMMHLQPDGTTVPFTQNPIKPGARSQFEMTFDRVPEGWNRNLPKLRIDQVGAQAPSGSVPSQGKP